MLLNIKDILIFLAVNVLVLVAANTEGEVRLADGADPWAGRVEIFHNGQWGSVCKTNFGPEESAMVCAEIGYTGGVRVSHEIFGVGGGEIWLQDYSCDNTDTRLSECNRPNGWGGATCVHQEDVGLVCDPPPGVYGEPHFMLISGNTHLCFNLHGKNNETFNLIADPVNDIYVRGTTFEIELENVNNPLSYFSAIGITAKNHRLIFRQNEFVINGHMYSYDSDPIIHNGYVSIIIRFGSPTKLVISLGDSLQLMVTRSKNSDAGIFMGVYVLSKDGLSKQTGGILGQFIRTTFDVINIFDKNLMMFNDDHEDIHVTKTNQYSPTAKAIVECYFYGGINQGGLIGRTALYQETSLIKIN